MLKRLLELSLILLFSVYGLNVCATENLRQTIDNKSTTFKYFTDNDRSYSIEQIRKLPAKQWITTEHFNPYGLVNRHYWLHLAVEIDTTETHPLYLEIANPLVDQIDVYLFKGDQARNYTAGDKIKTIARPIATPVLYFPLPNSDESRLDIYIEYRDDSASFLPLAITNSKESFEQVNGHGIFTGMIIGLMLILLLLAIMLYRHEKSRLLQYFVGLLVFGTLTILALEGVASVYIWPTFPWLQNLTFPSLFLLTLWCVIELTRTLLISHLVKFPAIDKTLFWLSKTVIIISPILFAIPAFIAIIVSVIVMCISLIVMSTALTAFTIKSTIVKPWLLASWSVFIVSLTLKTLYFSGLTSLPAELMTLATIFYCLQFILWGGIILQRYIHHNVEESSKNDKLVAQLVTKSKENDERLSENQQEHLNLEALVNERTFELNVTLRELQETNRQLEEQATNDALTGVKNRNFFDQRLQAEYRLSRRQHTPISLLLLDADKFKNVNDSYGHLTGDKVLIEISKIASRVLKRPNDYVCRYGGEEFAILLSNTDEKGAVKVAEVIRQQIANTAIKSDEITINVSVSIGVSTLMINSETADDQLFDQADKALYHAKESGRNNVKSFQEFTLSNK